MLQKVDRGMRGASEVMKALNTNPIFQGLDEGWLTRLSEQSHIRRERKGKVLFIQEEQADWFYLVVDGWVKLFRETVGGAEAVLDVVNAPHSFGAVLPFDESAYSYSAQVVEESCLLFIPYPMLRQRVLLDHALALNMLNGLAHDSYVKTQEIEHLNTQNAQERIICFLLRLCLDHHSKVQTLNLPYDKTLISARLGMKPETFSRALMKLKDSSLIRLKGACVTIPDVQALIDYSCQHCSQTYPCQDKA